MTSRRPSALRRRRVAGRLPWCLIVLAGLATVAGAQPPPTPVRVAPVTRPMVQEQRLATGDLRAIRIASLAAQEPGLVRELRVREGDRLAAGDVIATLDRRRLELHLDRAVADLAVAKTIVDQRRLDAEDARIDLDTIRGAHAQGAVNDRELRSNELKDGVALALLDEARQRVIAIESDIQLLRERLIDTTIVAPFAGVVIARHTEVGQWVGEGAAVVDVLAIDAVEVWIDVPQEYYDLIRSGDPTVTLEVDATGRTIESTSMRIIPRVDARARNFRIVMTLDNGAGALAPGMSITAWVPTGASSPQLTVPRDAILRNDAGAYLYVVREQADGAAPVVLPAPVQILFPWRDRFVVRADRLHEGDRVVVEGN
ncbi:MAG: efflux RND transporter periplasmic adaptor subunit, partial [Phycisphaerales bacterium]|nr:efflux RND transporter periplasmic adaptor subunit [Phycisphaerales bacterium]